MIDNDDDGRRTRASGCGFTDSLWGKRARAVVQSAQRLRDSNWDEIQAHVSAQMQGVDHDDDENKGDSGSVGIDAYAQIEIDW